jgi:hypothetical protein
LLPITVSWPPWLPTLLPIISLTPALWR